MSRVLVKSLNLRKENQNIKSFVHFRKHMNERYSSSLIIVIMPNPE